MAGVTQAEHDLALRLDGDINKVVSIGKASALRIMSQAFRSILDAYRRNELPIEEIKDAFKRLRPLVVASMVYGRLAGITRVLTPGEL